MSEYEKLCELLNAANDAYYKNSSPIMSDYEYDQKMKELEAMEKEQGYVWGISPSAHPGSDLENENTENSHKRPMLSLENTYNKDDVEKWYRDMCEASKKPEVEVVVNPKWDGNSGAMRYANGSLYKALTRGSGTIGEDMTANCQLCAFAKLKGFSGEARGEVIMTEKGFDEINFDGRYQNARNLVSGSLKLLDQNVFKPRAKHIKFIAYWLEESKNKTYKEDLDQLLAEGFEVGPYYICHNLKEVLAAINKIEKENFNVKIDGAVMKLNDKTLWNSIGSTAKCPRWAKAYKYEQETIESVITDITFQVGRTGKITPVAWFQPKMLDGSIIQKATVNNEDFYNAMDIAIGDTVKVQKAAAIIPQIISVVYHPENRKKIPFPKTCPCCGSKLEKRKSEQMDYFCFNNNCKARIIDSIINYTKALEIDGFAEKTVDRLFDAGLLKTISDIYTLKDHKTEIAKLERMSEKIIDKLCDNIENTKSAGLDKVLTGLGIPGVGSKMSKVLAEHYKHMDRLREQTVASLMNIEGIAETTAESIVEYFNDHAVLILNLNLSGVKLSYTKTGTKLSGKVFVITGALEEGSRKDYERLIVAAGGELGSSVTEKTNYLVTNDMSETNKSAKAVRARTLGVPFINETELRRMLNL